MRRAATACASLTLVFAVIAGCSSEPPTDGPLRIVVIGDSYTGGSAEGGRNAAAWPRVAREELRSDGVDVAMAVSAHGGSGYLARGVDGSTFLDAVLDISKPDDDVVVIFGGINDANWSNQQERAAVREVLKELRQRSPEAELIVVGPAWPASNPTPQILSVRDVLRAESSAVDAAFVDPIADRWFADRPDLIGDDGIHPTDDGHRLMAQKLEPYLRSALPASRATG
ncbi:SGNH/GDSL hydrolase family protein [Mycolicibacterium novocastrense]|nr:SGNH/GDSL hydrolase family protein [Mycolicibacterium novocastrense]